VRIYGGKKGRAYAVKLVLLVGDMRRRPRVTEFFRKTKVDNIDHASGLSGAHDKVGGLDVAVDEAVVVDELYAGDLRQMRPCHPDSTRLTSWSVRRRTVLSEKWRLHILKRSSSDGPRRSMTMTL
jgi:hypothetical protein